MSSCHSANVNLPFRAKRLGDANTSIFSDPISTSTLLPPPHVNSLINFKLGLRGRFGCIFRSAAVPGVSGPGAARGSRDAKRGPSTLLTHCCCFSLSSASCFWRASNCWIWSARAWARSSSALQRVHNKGLWVIRVRREHTKISVKQREKKREGKHELICRAHNWRLEEDFNELIQLWVYIYLYMTTRHRFTGLEQ